MKVQFDDNNGYWMMGIVTMTINVAVKRKISDFIIEGLIQIAPPNLKEVGME
jgi:hypothetical protein